MGPHMSLLGRHVIVLIALKYQPQLLLLISRHQAVYIQIDV